MGNLESSLPKNSWKIKALAKRAEWLDVGVDDIFGLDFLESNFQGKVEYVGNTSAVILAAEASTDLAGQYGSRLSQVVKARQKEMSKRLPALCQNGSVFVAATYQRLHILQQIHKALQKVYDKVNAANKDVQFDQKALQAQVLALIDEKDRNLSVPTQLGLSLFATILTCLSDDCHDEDHMAMLLEILPLVSKLEPLSLKFACVIDDSVPKLISSPVRVLDTIRDFLYASASKSKRANQDNALGALVTLAVARGSLRDLLLGVELLLQMCLRNFESAKETHLQQLQRMDSGSIIKTSIRDGRPKLVIPKQRMLTALDLSVGPAISHEDFSVWSPSALADSPSVDRPVATPEDPKDSGEVVDGPVFALAQQALRVYSKVAPGVDGGAAVTAVTGASDTSSRCVTEPVVKAMQYLNTVDVASIVPPTENRMHESEVWSCGQNSYGELSHGDTKSRTILTQVSFLREQAVAQVAAGNEHTVVLGISGQVFTAGYNDNGQCGHGGTSRIGQLSAVEKLKDQHIRQVHAYNGCEHTLCVDDEGKLWAFGYNYRGQLGLGCTTSESIPQVVRYFSNMRVRLVGCSYYHSVVVCDNDEVYTFGRNDFGQLGHGDTSDKKHPHRVDSLLGSTVSATACGQYHSMFATSKGQALSCGKNDYGQLGVPKEDNCLEPKQVVSGALHDAQVSDVRCGYYHSVVLCANGDVAAFGRNDYGQLGLGHTMARVTEPTTIDRLVGKGVHKVAAGCYHTVSVGRGGLLYVFGRNNHGQLGTGDNNERHSPFTVRTLAGKNIVSLAAGFYHTVILTGGTTQDQNANAMATSEPDVFAPSVVLEQQEYSVPDTPAADSESKEDVLATSGDQHKALTVAKLLPERAAVAILANLQRFAERHLRGMRKFEPLATQTTGKRSYMFSAFCVEVTTSTFTLLLQLLNYFAIANARPARVRPHMVVAVMQLLRLNMLMLLKSGHGWQCRLLPTVGEGDDAPMRAVLQRVHACMIGFIQQPPCAPEHRTRLQSEAIAVLMVGLEIFYPLCDQQMRLLSALLSPTTNTNTSTTAGNPTVKTPPAVVPASPDKEPALAPVSTSVKKQLLAPLLDRMTDDKLLSQIVRMSSSTQDNCAAFGTLVATLAAQVNSKTLSQLRRMRDAKLTPDTDFVSCTKLLLALQRHVVSRAGTQLRQATTDTDTTTTDPESAQVQRILEQTAHTPKAAGTDDADVPNTTTQASRIASDCLVSFVKVLAEHGVAALTMALSVSKESTTTTATTTSTTTPATTATMPDKISSAAKILKNGLVGQLLPSLLVSLLMFVEVPVLACRLLPIVADLLRVCDAFNQRLGSVKDADRDFHRILAGTHSSSVYNCGMLPWSLQLEKTAALLGGRLSTTLVVGDSQWGAETEAREQAYSEPECEKWLGHPLLSQSLTPRTRTLVEALLGSGDLEPAVFQSRSESSASEAKTAGDSVSQHAHDDDGFAHQLSRGVGAGPALASWARKAAKKTNMAYFMCIRSMKKSALGHLHRAEDATAAAMLWHGGQEEEAALWAASLKTHKANKRPPPRVMRDVWKVVAKLSSWLASQRSKMLQENESTDDARESFRTLCRTVADRARFLLMFAPMAHATPWVKPCDPAMPSRNTHARDGPPFLSRHPRSRWRRVRVLFHCMCRWKRVSDPPAPPESVLTFVYRDLDSEPSCEQLLSLVVGNIKRAIYRKAGLVALRHLLALVSFSSIQADILQPLPTCLRDNPATMGSVRTHLDAVGPKLTGSVWKAFCSLYRMFSTILLESRLTLETSTLADAHLVKLVLESNGVKYGEGDCAALSSIGIFSALEKVLQRLKDCLQAAASMPQAVSSECVALVERCHAAAWNLFQLLSVQIVQGNPKPEDVASVFGVYYRIVLRALGDVSPKSAAAIRDTGKVAAPEVDKDLDLSSLVREQVLGRPRFFVHHEEGLTKSEQIKGEKDSGFTLSFWMFLNQTTTAHDRTVLLRSYGIGRVAPLIVLCGSDNALELRLMGEDGQVQKYRSQACISSYKWTQVGVSAHDNRIDLYINAALDSSHAVGEGTIPECDPSEPSICYMGCVTAQVRAQLPTMEVPASGIKGWLSRLQMHTKPLTKSHAQALYDAGAPPLFKPRDRGEKMCALLVLLARSDIGKAFLRRAKWLRLMFNFFSVASPQLQITTLRILYYILPELTPGYLDGLKLSEVLRQLPQEGDVSGAGVKGSLEHLMAVTGASLWQAPTNLTGGFDDVMADEHKHSLSTLSSCLLLLLQRLATAPNWTNAVRRVLHTTLTSLFQQYVDVESAPASPAPTKPSAGGDGVDGSGGGDGDGGASTSSAAGDGDSGASAGVSAGASGVSAGATGAGGAPGGRNLDTLRTGVAALCVLGGHPENNILDDASTVREATVLRMLMPLDKQWAPHESEEQELAGLLQSDIIHLLRHFLLQKQVEEPKSLAEEAKRKAKGGQLKSRTIRVMTLLVGQRQWLPVLFKHGLVAPLFSLATNASPAPEFITLKETESQIAKLRTRAHRLIDSHTAAGDLSEEKTAGLDRSSSSLRASRDAAALVAAAAAASVGASVGAGSGGSDSFVCPYCEEADLTEGELVEHVLEKHDDEDRQVVCPICACRGDHVLLHDFPAHLELRHMAALLDVPPPDPDRGDTSASPRVVEPSEELIQDLMQMGFLREWCVMALREQQNDMLAASTWIVDNLEMLNRLPRMDPLDGTTKSTVEDDAESDDDDADGPVDLMSLLLKESGEIIHASSFPDEMAAAGSGGGSGAQSGSSTSGLLLQPDLGLNVLLPELARMERVLTILCARKGMLRLFACLIQLDDAMDTSAIHAPHLPLLGKMLAFRGSQLGWRRRLDNKGGDGDDNLLDTMWHGFRYLVQTDPSRFCPVLLSLALEAFTEAATKPSYRSTKWGHRECVMSDATALTEPNVELAFWSFKMLSSCAEAAPLMFGQDTFERLLSCLYTANVHVKQRICQCLKWSIHAWISSPELAGGEQSKTAEFVTALGKIPRLQLKGIIDIRSKVEANLGKPFCSGYLRSLMELMVASKQLEQLLPQPDTTTSKADTATSKAENATSKAEDPPAESESSSAAVTATVTVAIPSTPPPTTPSTPLAAEAGGGGLGSVPASVSALTPTSSPPRVPTTQSTPPSAPTTTTTTAAESLALSTSGPVSLLTTPTPPQLEERRPTRVSVSWYTYWPSKVPPKSFTYTLQVRVGPSGSFVRAYNGTQRHCVLKGLDAGRQYECRVRVENAHGGTSKWSESLLFSAGELIPFTFDSKRCGAGIEVEQDGLCTSFGGSEMWSTVLGTTGFMVGSNTWNIRINQSATAYIFIGVATKDVDLCNFLGSDQHGWGYIGDRALYHRRSKVSSYGERFSEDDTIAVTLDMDRGTLSFARNGVDLGVAFEGLSGELFPAVAFYNRGQRLSLLTDFDCPGAGVVTVTSTSGASCEDVTLAAMVMKSLCDRTPLAPEFVERSFEGHREWSLGRTHRARTRLGSQKQFNISERVCRAYGFLHNDRVATPRGPSTVVGVADYKLWFVVDGELGAWFFSPHEMRVNKRLFTLLSRTPKTEEMCRAQKESTMSRAEFERSVRSPFWHDRSWDELIVEVVNEQCVSKNQNPWNIDHDIVKKHIAPTLKDRGSARRMVDRIPSVLDIGARFSMLKSFNELGGHILPFCRLTSPLNPFESSKQQGKKSVTGINSKGVDELELGRLLSDLRALIFLFTKKKIINDSIVATATTPKKADDDYDYPEILPQVLLNRPKASAARGKANPVIRISNSVFGQLFDEIHFLEPSIVRIAYMHPMDDGQQRSFKVKFEGEGVDDYGGPFREIFSQCAAELTRLSKKTEDDVSGEEVENPESRCSLSLLIPSSNRVDGGGDDSYCFVLNPILATQKRSLANDSSSSDAAKSGRVGLMFEMLQFFGQMLGIAMRNRVSFPVDLSRAVWKPLVGQKLTVADLDSIDSQVKTVLGQVRRLAEMGDDMLESVELQWSTRLTDGSYVGVAGHAPTEAVLSKDIDAYVAGVVAARLTESAEAVDAVCSGLCSVVPRHILSLLTWKELRNMVSGRKEINIDVLMQCTEYDDDVSADDPHIKIFWQVLRDFNDQRRSDFLRFVWARARLPPTVQDFKQKFKVQAPTKEAAKLNPDKYLPKAHTCFFSLNLPRYSTKEIMREKLIYAMDNCVEMDADFRLAENEMTGWDEADR